jgi:polyferredoxin
MKPVKTPTFTEGRPLLSALLTLPLLPVLALLLTGGHDVLSNGAQLAAYLCVLAADLALFFLMLWTGKTDRWRAVLFISFALALSATFIVRMIEVRGHMSYNGGDILSCDVPFCHIVTTMVLIPMAFAQSITFPGRIEGGFADISSMLVIVAIALLVLGRGFCSWGCFYGGWDDFFSRLRKRPLITKISSMLRRLPISVLALVAITSAATLVPTYCDWICPFKTVTEYEAVTGVASFLKAAVFLGLFLGLVVVLPILTRRRTQCAYFCPMGALCTGAAKMNAHEIRIDPDKCLHCKKCEKNCPMGALDGDAIEKGRPSVTCSKCGRCVDECPTGAITYRLRWGGFAVRPDVARLLFLYAGWTFLAVFSGGSLQQFLLIVMNLVTKGSALS